MKQPSNKLFIFDLDGVLVDSKELHFNAFNEALSKVDSRYIISKENNDSIYDGHTTLKKLDILTKREGLPVTLHEVIWSYKQEVTKDLIKNVKEDQKLIDIFKKLNYLGFKICVASNSVRDSVKHILIQTGLIGMVDFWVSSQDVKHPKPHPEMFWKCMTEMKTVPKNTIIVEDSEEGKKAALDSGAFLLEINHPSELVWEKVSDIIQKHRL